MATAGAFAVLLVVATVVSIYLAIRAAQAERASTRERNRAVAAEHVAKAEAERATTEGEIARAVNDFLQQDLLGQADVNKQGGPDQKPDPDIKVRTLLDRAATAIGGKFAGQPAVEAALRRTIGDTYFALALYPLAEEQLERSVALARRELGDQYRETLNIIGSLARLYADQGKYAKAEFLDIEAFEGLRRVVGEGHPDTIRAIYRLGNLLLVQGKFSQADQRYTTALEVVSQRAR